MSKKNLYAARPPGSAIGSAIKSKETEQYQKASKIEQPSELNKFPGWKTR